MNPIRIALVGSGIFAREAHLPALQSLADLYQVAAIYSRTPEKAAALAAALPYPAEVTSDLPKVLGREDIEAVDIVLPIAVQPGVVLQALQAGKHAISEKPVAPDVASGQALLAEAAKITATNGRLWMVAENYRYLPAYRAAAQAVRAGAIGRPVQMAWSTSGNVNPQDQYYHTAWRRDNSFPGGYLLDKGVHNMAAMRAVLGEVESASAYVAQRRPDLPPADTLSATLRFASGAFGVFTATVTAAAGWEEFLQVVGDGGSLRVNARRLELTSGGQMTVQEFEDHSVRDELSEFGRVIRQGGTVAATPLQALQDLAVYEAMLESARLGRPVSVIQVT